MAINNTIELIGNMGAEARIVETKDSTFAVFSLATTDSYQDKEGNWQTKETLWHNIVTFNPVLIEAVKSFKKGTRLKITGSLSYRPFDVPTQEGKTITRQEASIIAKKVEQAPLAKK